MVVSFIGGNHITLSTPPTCCKVTDKLYIVKPTTLAMIGTACTGSYKSNYIRSKPRHNPYFCVFSGEATNTNIKVFGLK